MQNFQFYGLFRFTLSSPISTHPKVLITCFWHDCILVEYVASVLYFLHRFHHFVDIRFLFPLTMCSLLDSGFELLRGPECVSLHFCWCWASGASRSSTHIPGHPENPVMYSFLCQCEKFSDPGTQERMMGQASQLLCGLTKFLFSVVPDPCSPHPRLPIVHSFFYLGLPTS